MNEGAVAAALRRAYAAIDPSLDTSGEQTVEALEKVTGRAYPPAAAPGMPPARRTGVLQRGFRSYVNSRTLSIYNTAKHFKWTEEGTSKMEARPVLGIARSILAAKVPRQLARDIVRAERKRR